MLGSIVGLLLSANGASAPVLADRQIKVEAVEEYYSSGGIRSESHTSELESYTPGE